MPAPIAELSREMLHNPVTINLERQSVPATGITQAVYPVPQHLKAALLVALLRAAKCATRWCSRGPSTAPIAWRSISSEHKVNVERIHGNRSQAQRTEALAGFKNGRYQVLVATDIAARGIDVTALGHVINFDVPGVPDDYIHRVGRTARAELTGSAFTLVAPEDENDIRNIERAINKRLPRVTISDFDYQAQSRQRSRSSARAAHRGDSRAQGGRTAARQGECRSACQARWVDTVSRSGGAAPGQGPQGPRRGSQPGQGGGPPSARRRFGSRRPSFR